MSEFREGPPQAHSKRQKVVDLVLPTVPLRRMSRAFGETRASLRETLKQFKAALPDQPTGSRSFEEGDPRGIEDPRERFEALYAIGGWSEQELDEQRRAVVRTKLVALIMSVVTFSGVLGALVMAPLWMLLFIVPLGGSLLILGLAQTFKFAHYQAQLEMRSLISARQFASLPDFLVRLVG